MTAGRLYWVQRDGAVAEIPMSKPRLLLGRGKECDVRLKLPSVSSQHAAITRTEHSVTIEDLRSTNGVKVNGRKISTLQLKHGDQIEIGTERLVYFTDASLPPAQFDRLAGLEQNTVPNPAARAGKKAPNPNHVDLHVANLLPVPSMPPAEDASQRGAVFSPPRGAITLLSGRMSGKKFPLTKSTTTLGQEGAQVFQIVMRDDTYWVARGAQSASPSVNGIEVGERGLRLAHNDIIELAGARVRFELDPG
jgi:pSer/pThr/pTyr-binding forkhead associated (FHA) protein